MISLDPQWLVLQFQTDCYLDIYILIHWYFLFLF